MSGNESNDESAVEALEVEDVDFKLFTNLTIPRTQEMKDTTCVVLYCIEYDALFKVFDQSVAPSDSNPYLVKETVNVYRRFSEFITLQKVLEQHKHIRKALKGIKKPSSIQITAQNLLMFAGSSAKLDSSTIEFRRIFLKNFLQKLCNIESIAGLPEFQQFLAYGSDARIAFVKSKSHNISPLDINKVIYKGIKGVIGIMKTALPVEPQVGKIDPISSDRIPDNEKLTILTKVENNNTMQLEKKLNKWKENECDSTLINFSCSNEETTLINTDLRDHLSQDSSISEALGPRSRGDGCEANDVVGYDRSEVPEVSEESAINKIKVTNENKSSLSTQIINSFALSLINNVMYVWQLLTTKLIELIFGPTIEKLVKLNN